MRKQDAYKKRRRWQMILLALSLLLYSCTRDAYEKGEGKYSLTRADFAEAFVNSNKQVTSIVTDDGDELALTTPYKAKWVSKADTTYRCYLYYNKVEGKAEVLSMAKVTCPTILLPAGLSKGLITDPVKFESMWLSKTGKYLNLSLYVKTGEADDSSATQKLDIIQDKLIVHPDNKCIRHLILFHDQSNIPEYYSHQVYISIPTNKIDADSVGISINTYDNGEIIVKRRCR